MDEARRFLRYVIPGIVFLVESFLLLWILFPDVAQLHLRQITSKAGVGFALGALLGSGGIGFVFGIAHHWLHWYSRFDQSPLLDRLRAGMDFRSFIKSVRSTNALVVLDLENKLTPPDAVCTRFEAWAIVTAIWYERLESCPKIKGADTRASSLADLMHSMGTARVAAICSILLAVVVASRVGVLSLNGAPAFHGIAMIVVWVILVLLHHAAYQRTSLAVTRFVQAVLHDSLVDEQPIATTHAVVEQ